MRLFKYVALGAGGMASAALIANQINRPDPASPPPIQDRLAAAEGILIDVSADGMRVTLQDEMPQAEAKLKNLFNLSHETPQTDTERAFKLAPEVSPDRPFRLGETLRVRFNVNNPNEAVSIERMDALTGQSETTLPAPVSESRLAREIRWALREDARLSLKGRLVHVRQELQGIVLEGTVVSESERLLIEEKAQRMSNGCPVISRLLVSTDTPVE